MYRNFGIQILGVSISINREVPHEFIKSLFKRVSHGLWRCFCDIVIVKVGVESDKEAESSVGISCLDLCYLLVCKSDTAFLE